MFNPIFHGPLLILSFFLTSYFSCFGWKNPRINACARPLLLGARTDCGNEREHTLIFRRFHSVIFWLLLLTFSRLIGLFPNAVLLFSERYFSMLFIVRYFRWIFSRKFIQFCQCISFKFQWYFHLIFSKLLFNYLVSKLFELLFIVLLFYC